MLSTETRLRLEAIANKIATHQNVSLSEMEWAQKWADHNRSAYSLLRRARRIATQGEAPEGSMDKFLQDLDAGEPDPSDYLIGPQDPDTLAKWFKAPPWMKRD